MLCLFFFYCYHSLTREEVLELVPPATNEGPEGTDHPRPSQLVCTCSCGDDHTHYVICVCRGRFNTSLVFNWMEVTMLSPLGIASLRTLSYKALNW